MFCNQCGARLQPGVTYCTHCGKAVGAPGTQAQAAPVAAVPLPPAAAGRVTKHRNVLGVLWIVAGVITLPGAMVLMGISSMRYGYFGWGSPFGGMPPFLAPLFGFIGICLLAFSVLSIITGAGLLSAQSWARMLAIVLGIVRLINIPLGTALGIYTLWVLLPEQSNLEYGQLAQQRARA
jgi:hypothetical protein